jgi:hypothetical protein
VDGDIVTIPAGTFTWTSALNITKGITLQGQTTISGAGTANPIIKDLTIIRDDTPRRGAGAYILAARMDRGTQSFRLTGITFAAGTTTAVSRGLGPIRLFAKTENKKMRVDHCHFDQLYQTRCIFVNGWCEGVADHNVMKKRTGIGSTEAILIFSGGYGSDPEGYGNGSWADYPWYGTDKFFFIEDNTILEYGAATDTQQGARFVFRHNYSLNAIVAGHGTESGSPRGGRSYEAYGNTFHFTKTSHLPPGGQRSGTSLWHDNSVTGTVSASSNGVVCNFTNYRETSTRHGIPIWGIADGTSPWDMNDTEGNGTYVEGHPPYLFASGSATSRTITFRATARFSDSTKNWTPNQWVGYSIRNTNPASGSYRLGSYIISNTSNTITYVFNNAVSGAHLRFNAGDTYEIHRVLVMMDQNGRGKGDRIIGNPPVNLTTRRASWPHQALEPCFSWNNVYTPTGTALGFGAPIRQPTTKANIDFFNLGAGFPANSTPAFVSSTYTAALNGVAYTGPYIYPHPLTALPIGAARAVVTDFNGEGSPDYVLQRASTHQTGIWYLDNNVYASSAFGPTLSAGWKVVAAADFNGEGKPDYLLYNGNTQQTGIYYLNNSVYIGSGYGPTLPRGWELVGAADFNGDSNRDYLLYNGNTQQTGIYYLNHNIYIGSGYGPTLPPGWILVAAADFNSDGNPDYLLYNRNTQQTGIYYLNHNIYIGSGYGPTLPPGWILVAAADFNSDGNPDYLLYNVYTQQTGIYYLNNNVYVASALGPTVSVWSLFGP